MLNKIFTSLSYRCAKLFSGLIAPRILSRKKNFQGKKTSGIRIGNTTFIDHKHNLILDNNVYIGHHNYIEASNGISISKGVQITSFITITTHSSHNSIRLYGSTYADFSDHIAYEKGPVTISEYTFIGPYSVLMPNTRIGKGCIIVSHSYVKGVFPDFSIIAGNPAKVVGDVREKDNIWLERHPDLKKTYLN